MICEVCGCTDDRACFDPETEMPCAWAEPGLCSVCARTRGPLMRIFDAGRRAVRRFFPPARQHVLAAVYAQVLDDMAGPGEGFVRQEDWYCGDPTCIWCLEECRVPESEIGRQ